MMTKSQVLKSIADMGIDLEAVSDVLKVRFSDEKDFGSGSAVGRYCRPESENDIMDVVESAVVDLESVDTVVLHFYVVPERLTVVGGEGFSFVERAKHRISGSTGRKSSAKLKAV